MRYRADISGLRALAVIPVVLFHADPRLAPGGFVGVDVFFVISGYLITSIIAADLAQGRFSLLRFYDRRVRRILPAYVLVAAACTLAGLVLLPPGMLAAFGQSLAYASVFLANQHFLAVTGYFAPGVDEQLLLHTWSLAIEEQFYLFWPVLLLGLSHPRLRRVRPLVVLAIALASLWVATTTAIARPERAFFSFFGRSFELLIGAALALGLLPKLASQRMAEAAAALGVVLIGGAAAMFHEGMIFPGATALVPTMGAALILAAGEEGRTTLVGRVLSITPLVFIGLISYSLYLWHWPVFALFRLQVTPHPSLAQLALLIAGVVAVSAVSWRYVETPFRHAGASSAKAELRTVGLGLAALAVLVVAGAGLSWSGGLPWRADAATRTAEAQAQARWRASGRCLLGPNATEVRTDCRFGDPDPAAPVVALWGDSFANQYAPALDVVARRHGFGLAQITKAGCAPGVDAGKPGLLATREASACARFRANSLAAILNDPTVKEVVVGGNFLVRGDLADQMAALAEAVRRITSTGRGVVLAGPAVQFDNGGGRCIVRRRFLGRDDEGCAIAATAAAQAAAPLEAALARIASSSPRVRLVLARPHQCASESCAPAAQGGVTMNDRGHLNVDGALAMTEDLDAALRALRAGAAPQ